MKNLNKRCPSLLLQSKAQLRDSFSNLDVVSPDIYSVQDRAHFKKKIMVVDDDFYQREAICMILQVNGISIETDVLTVSNGKRALEKFQQVAEDDSGTISLIFMDCNMPVMDGYTATKEILDYC